MSVGNEYWSDQFLHILIILINFISFLRFRMKKAYSKAYKIAVTNFDSIPVISTCTLFIDLLGMDSRCMRVDVESSNFILKNWKKKDDSRYDTVAKLKSFIGNILTINLFNLRFSSSIRKFSTYIIDELTSNRVGIHCIEFKRKLN